jgi:BlaI family penicillinase repressor
MRLSESEWQIMNALWKRSPATAREIIEQLPDQVTWAYTTVKTMLTRLEAKKAVAERKRGNTSVYKPLISRKQARRGAFINLFDKVLDGTAAPLLHFLIEERKISEKERKELIRMLQEMDQEGDHHDGRDQ